MKKKKLNLFLNIVTICLCLCAIAIGVYSVKNASLNVSGTIGFTANNCKFTLSSIVNCASTTDATATIKDFEAVTNSFEAKTSETLTHSLGALNFNDVVTGGNVVKITLTFTNDSNFDIKIAMTDNVTFVTNGSTAATGTEKINSKVKHGDNILTKGSGEVILDTSSNKTADIVVTLTIAESDLDSLTALAGKLQLSFSVGQYVPPIAGIDTALVGDFYYDAGATGGEEDSETFKGYTKSDLTTTAKRNYVEMGTYNGKALRWYLFAKGNKDGSNMQAVKTESDVIAEGSALPSGTYWFISEYALGPKKFNESFVNVYEGSIVQTYITDETSTTDTFFTEYGITTSTDPVYSKIAGRIINDKESPNVATDCEGACTTTTAQKLWLLSEDELDLINGGESVKSQYESVGTHYKNILALKGNDVASSLVLWWLRTPIIDTSSHSTMGVFGVSVSGYDRFFMVNSSEGYVRPAFQIII